MIDHQTIYINTVQYRQPGLYNYNILLLNVGLQLRNKITTTYCSLRSLYIGGAWHCQNRDEIKHNLICMSYWLISNGCLKYTHGSKSTTEYN